MTEGFTYPSFTTKRHAITFLDLLPESEDYPVAKVLPDEILPFGTSYRYVSSSFVNGFINCGELIAAFMLNRYRRMDQVFEEPRTVGTISYRSKQEFFDRLEGGWAPFHTDISNFEDDVLLLKRLKSHDEDISYLYIWCDCDVSDCCIGRFRTDLPEAEVIRLFYEYGSQLAKRGGHHADPVPLNMSWFRGWFSF